MAKLTIFALLFLSAAVAAASQQAPDQFIQSFCQDSSASATQKLLSGDIYQKQFTGIIAELAVAFDEAGNVPKQSLNLNLENYLDKLPKINVENFNQLIVNNDKEANSKLYKAFLRDMSTAEKRIRRIALTSLFEVEHGPYAVDIEKNFVLACKTFAEAHKQSQALYRNRIDSAQKFGYKFDPFSCPVYKRIAVGYGLCQIAYNGMNESAGISIPAN